MPAKNRRMIPDFSNEGIDISELLGNTGGSKSGGNFNKPSKKPFFRTALKNIQKQSRGVVKKEIVYHKKGIKKTVTNHKGKRFTPDDDFSEPYKYGEQGRYRTEDISDSGMTITSSQPKNKKPTTGLRVDEKLEKKQDIVHSKIGKYSITYEDKSGKGKIYGNTVDEVKKRFNQIKGKRTDIDNVFLYENKIKIGRVDSVTGRWNKVANTKPKETVTTTTKFKDI
jgi:hypothetical protein